MKLAHILLASIAVIFMLSLIDIDPVKSIPPCPHPRFLARHLCSHCTTLDDAEDFSRYRPAPSGRNTVFFGTPRFEVKTYIADRCGNIDPAKVAVCTSRDRRSYSCTWLGQVCYGEHSIRSGHLFYNAIKC